MRGLPAHIKKIRHVRIWRCGLSPLDNAVAAATTRRCQSGGYHGRYLFKTIAIGWHPGSAVVTSFAVRSLDKYESGRVTGAHWPPALCRRPLAITSSNTDKVYGGAVHASSCCWFPRSAMATTFWKPTQQSLLLGGALLPSVLILAHSILMRALTSTQVVVGHSPCPSDSSPSGGPSLIGRLGTEVRLRVRIQGPLHRLTNRLLSD